MPPPQFFDHAAVLAEFAQTHTFTWRTIGPVDLKVDLLLPKDVNLHNDGSAMPLLVYWHGGGLTAGARDGIPPIWQFRDAIDAGYAILAPDYTLLTPANGHEILQDVRSFSEWLKVDLDRETSKLGLPRLDINRMSMTGSSAGGWLAYTSAQHTTPKPRSMGLVYPMGGSFLRTEWLEPHPAPELNIPGLKMREITREAHLDIIDVPSDSRTVNVPGFPTPRHSYFFWLKSSGTFLDTFTGDPGLSEQLRKETTYEGRAASIPSAHVDLLPELAKIDAHAFPPTIFIHGAADSLIVPAESRSMLQRLQSAGVDTVLHEVENADHGFDTFIRDSAEMPVLQSFVPFLRKYV